MKMTTVNKVQFGSLNGKQFITADYLLQRKQ